MSSCGYSHSYQPRFLYHFLLVIVSFQFDVNFSIVFQSSFVFTDNSNHDNQRLSSYKQLLCFLNLLNNYFFTISSHCNVYMLLHSRLFLSRCNTFSAFTSKV